MEQWQIQYEKIGAKHTTKVRDSRKLPEFKSSLLDIPSLNSPNFHLSKLVPHIYPEIATFGVIFNQNWPNMQNFNKIISQKPFKKSTFVLNKLKLEVFGCWAISD